MFYFRIECDKIGPFLFWRDPIPTNTSKVIESR